MESMAVVTSTTEVENAGDHSPAVFKFTFAGCSGSYGCGQCADSTVRCMSRSHLAHALRLKTFWLKGGHMHSNFCSMQVTPCWRSLRCPYLQRRCCLFGHTSEEVASSPSEGVHGPQQEDAATPVPQRMEETSF